MKTSRAAWLLIVLVLLTRIAVVLRALPVVSEGDSTHYDELARNIAHGHAHSVPFHYPCRVAAAGTIRPALS